MPRHLVSLRDLDLDSLKSIVRRSVALSNADELPQTLRGRMVGVWFQKTSTRTRTSFSVAAQRLGAGLVSFGPQMLQTVTGESLSDTSSVLGQYLDALVVRTAGPIQDFRTMAAAPGGPAIVNAMSEDEHPTQAISDFAMLVRKFGEFDRLRMLYVGEGNNTAAALARLASRWPGFELTLLTPEGFGLTREILDDAAEQCAISGSSVVERHSPHPSGPADVVYTTRWETTGTTKADHHWREKYAPFRVTRRWMADIPGETRPIFMHDLPAVRGDEVDADVLDGPESIALEQARQKMFTGMAVLEWCLGA